MRAPRAWTYKSRLVTSLAVLTEATYLLGFSLDAQQSLLAFVSSSAVELADFGAADVARGDALMKKYGDLPMDLAEATLVVLGERLRTPWLFTLDHRDFSIYRLGRGNFRILPE